MLVTGVTGLVGRLVAATMLAEGTRQVVVPVREGYDEAAVREMLVAELDALGAPREAVRRAVVVPMPPIAAIAGLEEAFREHRVREVLHCAGCLSYFNRKKLQEGNQDFTAGLLAIGKRTGIDRFLYVSTAFCSGMIDDVAAESLHRGAGGDPTAYMESKRETEWMVAESGIPWVIVRPSIVIGDSRTGRYVGKPYGLYQLWAAAEKFICDRYMPYLYAIAPRIPLQVVHQDAVQAGIRRLVDTGVSDAIVHLVSREKTLPTVRDLWDLWLDGWARPTDVYYYDSLDDVPLDDLEPDERLLVEFAAANIEISTHYWRFETTALEGLRSGGLDFADAGLESVARCQAEFMRSSPRIEQFLAEHADKRAIVSRVHEHSA